MDGDVKMFLSIYKCFPSIMALTHIEHEKYHSHKVNKAKIDKIQSWMEVVKRLSPSVSMCHVSGSTLETEKYHKTSEAYHKVNDAKIYRSNPYMDDAVETILPICKCLQSALTVPNIGTKI